jgi:hypothetical protein
MQFRYKKFSPEISRPVIPISVCNKDKCAKYEVLVDSGADVCLFDAGIGELLGIDVLAGQAKLVGGVAGQTVEFYIHPVEIEVGGHRYKTDVGFLPEVTDGFHYGVVGQKGFFDHFSVKFEFQKQRVEVKPLSL